MKDIIIIIIKVSLYLRIIENIKILCNDVYFLDLVSIFGKLYIRCAFILWSFQQKLFHHISYKFSNI